MKLAFLLALMISVSASAAIKLPAIVASGMVLQQQANAKIWGWADSGQTVVVTPSWNSQSATAVANSQGRWEVALPTPVAGGPFEVHIVAGPEQIILRNVLVGEVWFCSGQSNMEFPVGKTAKYWHVGVVDFEKEVAAANFPQIHLFTVAQRASEVPLDTMDGQWQECNPATVNGFSAVAYFYGRMLHQKLNVPVGLIHSSWGGTPAEAWTRREVLQGDTAFRSILDNEAKILQAYPEANAKYQAKLAQWKEGVANGSITGKAADRGPSAPMGPGHSKMPSVLYNGMVAPVLPYTIKGAIWYQGESNNDDAETYAKLFPAMVQNWRNDWQLGDFPFYFVQIASHYKMKPELREAQTRALSVMKNMGMAVAIDLGDSTDIHPIKKRQVGERLALWSLANTYGQKGFEFSGPLCYSAVAKGHKIIVTFTHVGRGLEAKGGQLNKFEIAGEDGVYVPAQAKIKGSNVEVSSQSVKKPVYVRYAWTNYLVPDLFNKDGLPASPFRAKAE